MILHKALLDYQKTQFEKETKKTLNPYETLNAALNDRKFEWLKPLSQMIIELDIESDDFENPDRKSTPIEIEKLKDFFTKPSSDFHGHLLKSIEADPDISFLFSKAKQSVLNL